MGLIEELPELASTHTAAHHRPLVTVCYAQSLDGSIAARRGSPLFLSSEDSFRFVHRLRAVCDGILVGIGTVLADDPQLTVRLVPGEHPQPIILDSALRFPRQARLMQRQGPRPWIFTARQPKAETVRQLENGGARVFTCQGEDSERIHLPALLEQLYELGIRNLMVEGGSRVITSFLQARLADYMVITLVPVFVGGLRALEQPLFTNHNNPPPVDTTGMPRLSRASYQMLGGDLVITGRLE